MSRARNHPSQWVKRMPKLSPRETVKVYQVSRATLMKALQDGTLSAEKTAAGHWQIDAAELARVYQPRASQKAVSRTKPEKVSRNEPDQKTAFDQDTGTRLAVVEAELAAERVKVELLERHVADLRRLLPAPDAKPRRNWWPW